jgi:soluble lytic murein transglycosylase-like protein
MNLAIVGIVAAALYFLASSRTLARPATALPSSFPYEGFFRRYATSTGVPVRLMVAVVAHESSFNAKAVNPETAADKRKGRDVDSLGLCQILWPDTAKALDPEIERVELFDPEKNLALGFRLMASLLRAYPGKDADGFASSAVAAYNAGSPKRGADGSFVNQSYVDAVHRQWRTYGNVA